MKPIQVELPDALARELDELVQDGWFSSEAEVVRLALIDFIRRQRFTLQEQFQREDIAWALRQRGADA